MLKEYSNDALIARDTSKYWYGDERRDFIRLNQAFAPGGSTSGHIDIHSVALNSVPVFYKWTHLPTLVMVLVQAAI